jgi:hypothetical protein
MRRLTWALLPLLALLSACPKRQTTAPDYDSVRQRSEQSHQSLDQQQAPSETR